MQKLNFSQLVANLLSDCHSLHSIKRNVGGKETVHIQFRCSQKRHTSHIQVYRRKFSVCKPQPRPALAPVMMLKPLHICVFQVRGKLPCLLCRLCSPWTLGRSLSFSRPFIGSSSAANAKLPQKRGR